MTAIVTFADAGNGKTAYKAVALHKDGPTARSMSRWASRKAGAPSPASWKNLPEARRRSGTPDEQKNARIPKPRRIVFHLSGNRLIAATIGGAAVEIDVADAAVAVDLAVELQVGAGVIAIIAIALAVVAVVGAIAQARHTKNLQAVGLALDGVMP